MTVFAEFTAECAHRLPNVPDGHKCGRLHGHSYHIRIEVTGPTGEATGWVIDYADIKQAFSQTLNKLDHNYLNDIPGLENPTCENIARFIWQELSPLIPWLSCVTIRETCTAGVSYRGGSV